MTSRKYDHIQPFVKGLGWLPVESIVKLKDATMMYNCMNFLAPKYVSDKFISRSDVHPRHTRNKSKLKTSLCANLQLVSVASSIELLQFGTFYLMT